MPLMEWLRKRLAGEETHETHAPVEGEHLSGLDLKQVLDVHMAWKDRLQHKLNGTSLENISIAVVAQDNQCELGKWLHGPGRELYAALPEYDELRKSHADFHLCAGEILLEHDGGNTEKATQILRGRFRDLSNHIQLDLVRLFAAARR